VTARAASRVRRPAQGIALAAFVLLAACAGRFLVVRGLDGAWLLGWPSPQVIDLRLAPILCALVAGAALGSAGAVLQTLLRNPLASPFVLGISSGAGAGVALASVLAGAAGVAAPTGVALVLPAAIGAFTALALVLGLSRRHGSVDPVMMVLAGVVVGTVAAALTMLAEALLPPDRRSVAAAWVLGRIPDVVPPGPWTACLLGAVGLSGLAAWRGRALDASALTDDEAASVGVALGRLRLAMFAACGLATAASVVLCGPIGFVGLLAPHLARPLTGPRNAPLVVASALLGAALLVSADAVRQWFDVHGGRLPIGALTATLGGIAFLVLLRRTAGGWIR
jgi:iron complex transport system permease protein